MKASELIKSIKLITRQYGDLDIVINFGKGGVDVQPNCVLLVEEECFKGTARWIEIDIDETDATVTKEVQV